MITDFLLSGRGLVVMIAMFWIILLGIGVFRRPQQLRNAFYLMNAILSILLAIAFLFDEPAIPLMVIFFGLLIFLVFVPIALIANGIIMLKHEGRRLPNALSLLTGLLILAGEIATVVVILDSGFQILKTSVYTILGMFSVSAIYFSLIMLGFVLYSVFVLIIPVKMEFDHIIIHGCGLKSDGTPSKILSERIDKAIKVYRKSGEKAVFIASGGKGEDEVCSEAASMKSYLMEKGIPEEKILLEDRSFTTMENLKFSREIVYARNKRGKTALVSSNYHIYRCLLYAWEVDLKCVGIGAHVANYFWPSALIREFVAVFSNKRKLIPIIIIWIILMIPFVMR